MDPSNKANLDIVLFLKEIHKVSGKAACGWNNFSIVFYPYPGGKVSILEVTLNCHLPTTFTNNFNPDQARQNVRPDMDTNCLPL